MDIQEESLLPLQPLAELDHDYKHAVLHIAWDRHGATDERTLLFAIVELLPAEIPPPIDDYDPRSPHCSRRLGHDSDHYVYVRHVVADARRALDWYRACQTGAAVLPENDGTIPSLKQAKVKLLKLVALGQHPIWPTLISAGDDTDMIPFVSQWIEHARTHHMLPLADFDRDALWSEAEAEAAHRWLEQALHFDLREFPEYWGSIHLVAPNPVYRRLDTRLHRRGSASESLLFRFQPRMGKSVEGLQLSCRERDPWGVTVWKHATLRSSLLRMNLDREVNAVMQDVWDPHRGFLHVNDEAHTFIRSIHLDLAVSHETSVRSGDDAYQVLRSGKPERSVVGTTNHVTSARVRMVAAHHARERRRVAAAQDQRWFRQKQEDARELLRSLLSEANTEVLVVDPYFAAEELGAFVLAVGRYDIPIRILSSAEVLRKAAPGETGIEKGDRLLNALRELQQHERMNPFEIRVMLGKRPAVHDRFLVIDKRIWLLGSSLNEFGSRGTMMLGLPDPEAARGDLFKAWDESQPLEDWASHRRASRLPGQGQSP